MSRCLKFMRSLFAYRTRAGILLISKQNCDRLCTDTAEIGNVVAGGLASRQQWLPGFKKEAFVVELCAYSAGQKDSFSRCISCYHTILGQFCTRVTNTFTPPLGLSDQQMLTVNSRNCVLQWLIARPCARTLAPYDTSLAPVRRRF